MIQEKINEILELLREREWDRVPQDLTVDSSEESHNEESTNDSVDSLLETIEQLQTTIVDQQTIISDHDNTIQELLARKNEILQLPSRKLIPEGDTGSFTYPKDSSYSGEHEEGSDDTARGSDTQWDRDDQGTNDGYKTSFVTGSAYKDDSDEKWYEYRIDVTWDSIGGVALVSNEYRVLVDEPTDCVITIDEGEW